MFTKRNVMNVPESAYDYKYWVVTIVDGDAWYWGAWNNSVDAYEVADTLGRADHMVLAD